MDVNDYAGYLVPHVIPAAIASVDRLSAPAGVCAPPPPDIPRYKLGRQKSPELL